MKDFYSRTPFALLSAVGFVSIVSDIITLSEEMAVMIDAWQAVTRPIWDFLFGWIFEIFNLTVPRLLSDYLTFGLINAGAHLRFEIWSYKHVWGLEKLKITDILRAVKEDATWTFLVFLFWPIYVALMIGCLIEVYYEGNPARKPGTLMYLEFFAWTLILIAINYALLFAR